MTKKLSYERWVGDTPSSQSNFIGNRIMCSIPEKIQKIPKIFNGINFNSFPYGRNSEDTYGYHWGWAQTLLTQNLAEKYLELKKNNDNLLQQLNEAKEKIKLLETKLKKMQINENFNKNINELNKANINSLENNIDESFFEIKSYYTNKIQQLIDSFTNIEKFKEKSFKELEKILFVNTENNKLINHLNIILAGPSGVGKSSLINAYLIILMRNV